MGHLQKPVMSKMCLVLWLVWLSNLKAGGYTTKSSVYVVWNKDLFIPVTENAKGPFYLLYNFWWTILATNTLFYIMDLFFKVICEVFKILAYFPIDSLNMLEMLYFYFRYLFNWLWLLEFELKFPAFCHLAIT